MADYGKIKSYDAANGTGTITPEKGGDALPFAKADLQEQADEPKQDARYGYETHNGEGGKRSAVKLELQRA